MRCKRKAK